MQPGRPPAWTTDIDLVELHDATAAEELYALESLGFFAEGSAGTGHRRGDTGLDTPGLVVNSSGGLVGRGQPLGATGLAQVVELANQLRGAPGRQVERARLALAVDREASSRRRRLHRHPRHRGRNQAPGA